MALIVALFNCHSNISQNKKKRGFVQMLCNNAKCLGLWTVWRGGNGGDMLSDCTPYCLKNKNYNKYYYNKKILDIITKSGNLLQKEKKIIKSTEKQTSLPAWDF